MSDVFLNNGGSMLLVDGALVLFDTAQCADLCTPGAMAGARLDAFDLPARVQGSVHTSGPYLVRDVCDTSELTIYLEYWAYPRFDDVGRSGFSVVDADTTDVVYTSGCCNGWNVAAVTIPAETRRINIEVDRGCEAYGVAGNCTWYWVIHCQPLLLCDVDCDGDANQVHNRFYEVTVADVTGSPWYDGMGTYVLDHVYWFSENDAPWDPPTAYAGNIEDCAWVSDETYRYQQGCQNGYADTLVTVTLAKVGNEWIVTLSYRLWCGSPPICWGCDVDPGTYEATYSRPVSSGCPDDFLGQTFTYVSSDSPMDPDLSPATITVNAIGDCA